ncbi:MAG: hypothetical protein K2K13_04010 [Clostridiales bacterium]|nr:hypothetical protein [Clostridiales bacterium]
MNNDLTTKNLMQSIKILLIILASFILVVTVIGIIFACNGLFGENIIFFFVIGYGIPIIVFLPQIINWAIQYKRFKKALKSCEIFYGNLNEVVPIFDIIFQPFALGCSLIINGQATPYLYSHKSTIKLVNTRVAYIFDGDRAYLLRQA